jgi:uncharacterized protein (TIGR03118 family)
MRNLVPIISKILPKRSASLDSRRVRLTLESLEDRRLLSNVAILQTNLVSDIPGLAASNPVDPSLLNPWGLAYSSTSPFWVSDNNAGVSTLYNGAGTKQGLVVNIPDPPPADPLGADGTPTGIVFNIDGGANGGFTVSANGKGPSSPAFIFATEDGTIAAWAPAIDFTHAIIAVNNAGNNFTEPDPTKQTGAVYKGLAIAEGAVVNGVVQSIIPTDPNSTFLLYASNFRSGQVDVFGTNFKPVTDLPTGAFTDPNLPKGYAPFDIQELSGKIYVTYALQNAEKHDDVAGQGHGFVDSFNLDGSGLTRVVTRGRLDSPWGLAIAPASFGDLAGDLLVGNFGNGRINAFRIDANGHGHFQDQLKDSAGHPIQIDGLWALKVGNDHAAGSSNTVFFTAGINDESDGLFGSLQAVPQVSRDNLTSIVSNLPTAAFQNISTVPSNGDVNPYGVAFVPADIARGGKLQAGSILVSNFNNSSNQQGTGSTIVQIGPNGQGSVFFQGPATGIGLTTALGVLKRGFVLVGNVPTTDGTSATVQQGSLMILDKNGNLVENLTDSTLLDGPWDLTINDQGNRAQVFVSNVLSGTVTRIDLRIPEHGNPIVESMTQIASGFAHRTDPNALVVGPTGLAYDAKHDILYVASTGDNEIFAIDDARDTQSDEGMGTLVFQDNAHLHGPLGLVLAPNGDLLATNGDAVNTDPNHLNEIVEFTPSGQFVGEFQVDPGNGGGAFGIALISTPHGIRLAAVDDNTNTLKIWQFDLKSDDS